MERQAVILFVYKNLGDLRDLFFEMERSSDAPQLLTSTEINKAFEIAKMFLPDIIVVEAEMLEMPDDLYIRLARQTSITCNIPILVLLSDNTISEEMKEAMDGSTCDFIRKRHQREDLQQRIRYMLNLRNRYKVVETNHAETEKKFRHIIQEKDRGLSSKGLELYRKNMVLQEVKARIEEVALHASGEVQQTLSGVVSSLKMSLRDRQNWDAFRTYFENVHPQFFVTLQQQYPKLTLDDLKYCAFMKMYMANNEIAQLLNINKDTVFTRKYRLKKKMGLDPKINLQEYIGALEPAEVA